MLSKINDMKKILIPIILGFLLVGCSTHKEAHHQFLKLDGTAIASNYSNEIPTAKHGTLNLETKFKEVYHLPNLAELPSKINGIKRTFHPSKIQVSNTQTSSDSTHINKLKSHKEKGEDLYLYGWLAYLASILLSAVTSGITSVLVYVAEVLIYLGIREMCMNEDGTISPSAYKTMFSKVLWASLLFPLLGLIVLFQSMVLAKEAHAPENHIKAIHLAIFACILRMLSAVVLIASSIFAILALALIFTAPVGITALLILLGASLLMFLISIVLTFVAAEKFNN